MVVITYGVIYMTTAKCLAKTLDVLYIEQAVEKPSEAVEKPSEAAEKSSEAADKSSEAADKSSEAAGISWRNRY